VYLYPIPDGFAIDKSDARRLMQRKFGIKARQTRAAISSYSVEDWAYSGANGTLFGVCSLDNRMLEHIDRRDESRKENGRKGGRRTDGVGVKQPQLRMVSGLLRIPLDAY
jgi:hypothetical protein